MMLCLMMLMLHASPLGPSTMIMPDGRNVSGEWEETTHKVEKILETNGAKFTQNERMCFWAMMLGQAYMYLSKQWNPYGDPRTKPPYWLDKLGERSRSASEDYCKGPGGHKVNDAMVWFAQNQSKYPEVKYDYKVVAGVAGGLAGLGILFELGKDAIIIPLVLAL